MLGFILLYFIGKRFYDLAEEYKQNKWAFAILGIITYYAVGYIFIISVALLDVYIFYWGFDWDSSFGMNLLMLPTGLLAVWVLYSILENRWKKSVVIIKDEIDDIGKNTEV